MRKLFYIFWGLAGLVILLMIVSYFFERHMGQDETSLKVEAREYHFAADRDNGGVWQVKVDRVEDLWFAFGYLQMWDREVQMELLRNASLGKLSSLVGEKVLSRDRLMRASARVSQKEWTELDEQSLVKRASKAYVEGVEHYRKTVNRPEPIEFKILGLSRRTMENWKAEDLLAIARYQAWQFSYDYDHELLMQKFRTALGDQNLASFFPRVGIDVSMYDDKDLKDHVRISGKAGLKLPDFILPDEKLGPVEGRNVEQVSGTHASISKSMSSGISEPWARLAASNLWVIKGTDEGSPQNDLTLCNDTHLRMSWPSPLYPIRYELDGRLEASGFSLPGVPGIVVGTVSKKDGPRMAWGVTIANFVDSQDLILDRKGRARSLSKTSEKYLVRDLEAGTYAEKEFQENWTDLGYDISDSYYSEVEPYLPAGVSADKSPKTRVYLDWIGMRHLRAPLEFYLKRNIFMQEGLESDLLSDWGYPSVNFSWIEEDSQRHQRAGHFLTGYQYLRNRKDGPKILDSTEVAKRRFMQMGGQKYFVRNIAPSDNFYLVSANQRTAQTKDFDDAAYSWESGTRAARIYSSRSDNFKDPTFSQTDYYPEVLIDFFQRARTKIAPNDICQIGSDEERDFCLRIWSRVAQWSGSAHENSWEMSVLSLWQSMAKKELFPKDYDWSNAKKRELFTAWYQKAFSDRALLNLMESDKALKVWESEHKARFAARLGELFSTALSELMLARGPTTQTWDWGSLHRIDWYYPLGEAPEPWGTIFKERLLGPPIPVGGGYDSPGSFQMKWNPENPVDFPAVHGAAMRACYEFKPGEKTQVRWAVPNGPSGNPFSPWARRLAEMSYFKKKLVKVE